MQPHPRAWAGSACHREAGSLAMIGAFDRNTEKPANEDCLKRCFEVVVDPEDNKIPAENVEEARRRPSSGCARACS